MDIEDNKLTNKQPGQLRRWLAGGCAILVFTAFIVPGIACVIYTTIEWREVLLLNQSGVVTQATVFDRSQTEIDEAVTYWLHYRFLADDHVYEAKDDVSRDEFYDTPLNSKVTVRYGRGDPTISQIGSETSLAGVLSVTIFTVIWNGLVILLTLVAIRESSHRRAELANL